MHVVYLINRMPSLILQQMSPYQLLNGNFPKLDDLKVFGCLCYASTYVAGRTKFDKRARKCVYLGFQTHMKGAVVYDVHSKSVVVSRNVVFHELIFPYKDSFPATQTHCWEPTSSDLASSPTHLPNTLHPTPPTLDTHPPESQHFEPPAPETSQIDTTTPNSPTHDTQPAPLPTQTQTPTLRRSTRPSKPPTQFQDYICATSTSTYPLSDYFSYSFLSPTHKTFVMSLDIIPEPTSYHEASQHSCWVEAMQNELQALEANKTWSIVDRPASIHPIGCKWVYKVKRKADGSLERYKARLVAKGYTQTEGIDYFDTFSPVVKMSTVRMLIALAAVKGWHIHQLDVNNAFLHGELQEEVYMSIPQGVHGVPPNKVCKLLKSLYGLKQASRKWYERLSTLLLGLGFKQSHSDHSLFTNISSTSYMALLIYVDDIVLVGDHLAPLTSVKKVLDANFGIKDLGTLKFFLGLEVVHSPREISVCQRQYCLNLLTDTGNLGSRPVNTPMDSGSHLYQDDSPLFQDVECYRRLVGKLLYLTTTRPDISFVVQQLSQFLSKPTMCHFKAVQRVLHYLKGTPGQGLFFARSSSLEIHGYSDSDWAGCPDSKRSISGYCFFLGDSLISWRSKKQMIVARSSSEAEYRALASATCELQWLCFLLADLGITLTKQPVLYCDNQSALHIAANPVFHERTKHLENDCHVVRDKVSAGLMRLLPLSSKHQVAELFTKALLPQPFFLLVSKLQMLNIYPSSACGGGGNTM